MIRAWLRRVRIWAIERHRDRLEEMREMGLAKKRVPRERRRFRPIKVAITHEFYVYPDGSVYHDKAGNNVVHRVKDPHMVKVVHAAYERMRQDVVRRGSGRAD